MYKRIILFLVSGLLFLSACKNEESVKPDSSATEPEIQQSSVTDSKLESEETIHNAIASEEPTIIEPVHNMITFPDGSVVEDSAEQLDLSGISCEDSENIVSLLCEFQNLTLVDLGRERENFTVRNLIELQQQLPQIHFFFTFELFYKEISTSDEELDFSHIQMDDDGKQVREILPSMYNLKKLLMDSCGVSNEAMASIRDDFPNVKVIWRVRFGDHGSCLTDSKVIWYTHGIRNDKNIGNLKYCTECECLDLGHNNFTDISFVTEMPNLRVVILALNSSLSDISPLSQCQKLEYVEVCSCPQLSDISPLANHPDLRHLNIVVTAVTDISPLYTNPDIERLWLGESTLVPEEQIETMRSISDNCTVDTTATHPTGGQWREYSTAVYTERYIQLREEFGYGTDEYWCG